ncbi:hypothetical protein AYI77_01975 [Shewanella algae]|uniref:hypothetical protein n=1 Tax=Shewanella algae TaxID=38313 RepID=UPI000D14D04C|nr:hypothetical protein [Shewanella algae]PST68889.1 hypothetical protein AYI77_01975 [Shewanella algae]
MINVAAGRAHLYLIGVLILACVGLGVALSFSKAEVATLNGNIEKAESKQIILQTDLDSVTASLLRAEKDKADLRRNADQLARLLGERERSRLAADAEAEAVDQATKELLEDPEDEEALAWAVTAVPAQLNRLLWHTSYCANGNSHRDSVCTAAGIPDEQLRNSGLSGADQPRSL